MVLFIDLRIQNVEIDAECRPIAGGDDSEITFVQSSSHHVTDLGP